MKLANVRTGAVALFATALVASLAGCAAPPTTAPTTAPGSGTGASTGTTVTGNLVFQVTSPLPADAEAEINLVDVTVEAGEPQVIATQEITIGSQASPLAFEVKYDASKINPEHTYGLAAKIVRGSEIYFTTTEPKFVLTQGNPSNGVEVPLAPGGPEATPAS